MKFTERKKSLLLTIALVILVSLVLFRKSIFLGRVPVAFDFGVYTYQPWRLDFEASFTAAPKKIGHDDIRIFYPQRRFIIESLKSGIIPFWNPYEFAGNVSLANSQTATFYPPFLLFFIFPQVVAWSLLSLSIPIIAGIGMLLYLRGIFKSDITATFGAIVFAFSSNIITRAQDGLVAGHSIIWLPWVLYGIERFYKKRKFSSSIIFASLSLSMLAGWFQFTFYVYAVGAIYAFLLGTKAGVEKQNNPILRLFFVFITSILLTAFHWMPALEALRYSPRGVVGTPPEFSQEHLMPLSHLFTLFMPNAFGHVDNSTYFGASEFKEGVLAIGIIPFLLSSVGLIENFGKKRVKIFFLLLISSLALGFKTPIGKFFLQAKLPLISSFLPNRYLMISGFSLSVLSAYGFRTFLSGKTKVLGKLTSLLTLLFALFYLSVAMLYAYEKLLADKVGLSFFEKGIERFIRISVKESLPEALFLILVIAAFKIFKKERRRILIAVAFLLTTAGLIIQADRYLYFSDPQHEFPANPIFSYLQEKTQNDKARFLSLSFSKIPSNIPSYYSLYNPEGVDALYPIWYGEFSEYFRKKSPWIGQDARIDVSFSEDLEKPVKYGESRWIDPGTINFLSHLGVRFLVLPSDYHDLPTSEAFKKVFTHKWHTVYEYQYAFPKAYFVSDMSLSSDKAVTLQRIFHPNFFALSEVTLTLEDMETIFTLPENRKWSVNNLDLLWLSEEVEQLSKESRFAVAGKMLENIRKNPVEITQYHPNRVSVMVNSEEDGFVVMNDSFYPGWRAEVDGESRPIFRANHAFRAVWVTAGRHTIDFTYQPQSFTWGLKLSALTALVMTLMKAATVVFRKRSL